MGCFMGTLFEEFEQWSNQNQLMLLQTNGEDYLQISKWNPFSKKVAEVSLYVDVSILWQPSPFMIKAIIRRKFYQTLSK